MTDGERKEACAGADGEGRIGPGTDLSFVGDAIFADDGDGGNGGGGSGGGTGGDGGSDVEGGGGSRGEQIDSPCFASRSHSPPQWFTPRPAGDFLFRSFRFLSSAVEHPLSLLTLVQLNI